MASIRIKNNRYYIYWYDNATRKQRSFSTGLKATKRNKVQANKILKDFEAEQTKKNKSQTAQSYALRQSTIEDAIKDFIEHNKNKSKKTIQGYKHFFQKFIDDKHFSLSDPVVKISKTSVEQWILSIDTTKYKQNTLYGITKNLNKFLNFLFEYNYIEVFKINKDLKFKPAETEVIIFEQEDIQLMFDNLKDKTDNFKKAFYLMLYTGLRPSDIIDIKRQDLDLENNTLKYYSKKTKTYNYIPVVPELTEALAPLIKDKKPTERILEYDNYLNIAKAINRFLKQLGLKEKKYNARTFRKTFISLAFESGVHYVTTAEIVGHKNILTTKKHYTKLSLAKTQAEVNKIKFHKDIKESDDKISNEKDSDEEKSDERKSDEENGEK